MGCIAVGSFSQYTRLEQVPPHRRLGQTDFLTRIRRAVHFEHVCFGGLDLDGYQVGYGRSLDTDMPAGFIDAYFAASLAARDPLILAGKQEAAPICDEEAADLVGSSPELTALQREFGVRNRYFIPLQRGDRVYAGVCFTRHRAFGQAERQFLAAIAEAAYQNVTDPLMKHFAPTVLGLTAGELICLRLASHGMTSEAISQHSKYQTETVNSYLKSATKKLDGSNRTEAIADAIRRRLIE